MTREGRPAARTEPEAGRGEHTLTPTRTSSSAIAGWAAAHWVDPDEMAAHLPHLVGKTWEQLEAEALAADPDPTAIADDAQIVAEFAAADAEAWAQIDPEDGGYPYPDTERAGLARLARERP